MHPGVGSVNGTVSVNAPWGWSTPHGILTVAGHVVVGELLRLLQVRPDELREGAVPLQQVVIATCLRHRPLPHHHHQVALR